MLHGPSLKAIVWCVTIAGLTPAVLLALVALAFAALSGGAVYRASEAADETVQNAEGLFVEIHSPFNGMARKCR